MATTSAVLSTLTSILKEHYLPPVVNQLNDEILALQILEVTKDHIDLQGLKAIVPLHDRRSGGVGSRAEGDDLPGAGAQGYRRAEFNLKYHYGRIQVSGQSIQHTKSGAGAFLQAYKSELDGIRNDLALEFARQTYGDGTGIVASAAAAAQGTTVPLTSSEAIVKGFLYIGMRVDIGTTSDPATIASNVEITDVDASVPSITLETTTSAAITTSHRIYRAGNVADGTTNSNEMDGIQKLISQSANTVGNLNAASAGYRFWDNLRTNGGGGAIALEGTTNGLLYESNRVYNSGVKAPDLKIVMSPGLMRRVFELADFSDRVQFVNTQELKGGFEELSFSAGAGRMRMVADRLAPWGSAMFVPTKHLKVFSPGDWDFLARDGQAVKWVQNKDAFQSILFKYASMGTDKRNNSLVMYNLADVGF